MAKKSEYGEASKYVTFKGNDDSKVVTSINEEAIEKDLKLAGYNLLVTSETKMKAIDIYNVYHNLWRIEESFRIMKSDLDARPVYLQKQETIQGHFLICYLAVLLERIFQFHILKNKYSSNDIYKFFKSFNVVKTDNKYQYLLIKIRFIEGLVDITNLPINHLALIESQPKKLFSYKF